MVFSQSEQAYRYAAITCIIKIKSIICLFIWKNLYSQRVFSGSFIPYTCCSFMSQFNTYFRYVIGMIGFKALHKCPRGRFLASRLPSALLEQNDSLPDLLPGCIPRCKVCNLLNNHVSTLWRLLIVD